jgi:hypothetical protein
MTKRNIAWVVLIVCGWCCSGTPARATERHLFLLFKKHRDADTQDCPNQCERLQRAGCPHCVARWARPPWEKQECGYYVGGGAAWFGDARCPTEGTWGWDYAPWYSRVRLGWWHGRKFQDGEGQYEADRHNNPLGHALGFGR